MAKIAENRKLDDLLVFEWKGVDKIGKSMKGDLQAKNITLAKNELRRQGIQVKKINKKSKPLFSNAKAIKPQDISLFSRQLATMMESGVPMVQAFEIIEGGQANPKMAKLINDVKTEIQSGSTLADSLSKHPLYFDELYCNLVAAGEKDKVFTSDLLQEAYGGRLTVLSKSGDLMAKSDFPAREKEFKEKEGLGDG